MIQYFFDTSALVKLYHEESGDIIVLPNITVEMKYS